MSKKLAIGIDLGGTGIKLGLVDVTGKLIRTFRFGTPSKKDPEEVAALIVEQAEALIHTVGKRAIVGIGVGAAGDVEPGTGIIRISPNLQWKDVPLKALLSRSLKYSIRVENDANVAAWAAYVVEAKRKVRNLLCVTLGTGIGGGIVMDGRLYRGSSGSAGEIGHMTLFPEGVPCLCGNVGCLERYVGARAMSEEARRAIEAGELTLITRLVNNDLSKIEPLVLQEAARKGDRLALQLWEQAGERLGITLAGVVNFMNPEWIVLAGGLSGSGKLLLDPLSRTIFKRSFSTAAKTARLIVSKLNQDLGIVGAGLVAHELAQ